MKDESSREMSEADQMSNEALIKALLSLSLCNPHLFPPCPCFHGNSCQRGGSNVAGYNSRYFPACTGANGGESHDGIRLCM